MSTSVELLLSSLVGRERGCVVLATALPWAQRRALQESLRERERALPLVILTADQHVLDAAAILSRGLAALISAASSSADLREAIEHSRLELDRRLARARARARWASLTTREREVCQLLARGMIDKQVAAELGTTRSTVQLQRARAFAKMGVSSAVEMSRAIPVDGDGPKR
ncbi:hypothetical protein G6O69_32660 [Pseudenhygromyxa sp. WMMC2535]|uniref:LuxR C-terminal-related transcriptional regulator n=1 Tax=Pseudenhygromyxa sp. WMMC2535 TaxID=2712867 RepID=UPI001552010B|nr:hypothetical protein [Pseudenhygromyxa sp. WMMC2535]